MTIISFFYTDIQKHLLLVGGYGSDGALDTVERLSLNSPTKTRGKFPIKIRGAVGTTLEGTPHVCGGWDDSRTSRRECWFYHAQENEWREGGQLQEARHSSAAAFHPNHGWVVTGGYGVGRKSIAERTTNGSTFETFTKLPIALSDHCMVSLNRSDRGDFFLAGGFSNGYSSKTFMYRNSKWMPMADMPTARRGLACGTLRGKEDEAVVKVVTIGGRDGSYLSNVEIYDLASLV